MRIFVTAKPCSKKIEVQQLDKTHFVVFIKEPARENKANYATLEALAHHFHISLSRVQLISGRASKIKVVEII